jgi:FkbM family methyltransferase
MRSQTHWLIDKCRNHPLAKDRPLRAALRFLKFQILFRTSNKPLVLPWIGRVKLLVKRTWYSHAGNVYFGLLQFDAMGFLLHFLREEDTFVDVGSNTGAFVLLASGVAKARSVALEPHPVFYKIIQENVTLNELTGNVLILQIGAASREGTLNFQVTSDDASRIAITSKSVGGETTISVDSLDHLLEKENPVLLRIDVVGFATDVLRGAAKVLANPVLKAAIIRDMGLAQDYGFDPGEVHNTMTSNGFSLYSYEPFTRILEKRAVPEKGNNLYLRDLAFVKNRVENAASFTIFGKTI